MQSVEERLVEYRKEYREAKKNNNKNRMDQIISVNRIKQSAHLYKPPKNQKPLSQLVKENLM